MKWHSDPGHGWLAVPKALIVKLNLEDKITSFSYLSRANHVAYLEEDCDASTFIYSYAAAGLGTKEEFRTLPEEVTDDDHWIRSLPRFPEVPGAWDRAKAILYPKPEVLPDPEPAEFDLGDLWVEEGGNLFSNPKP